MVRGNRKNHCLRLGLRRRWQRDGGLGGCGSWEMKNSVFGVSWVIRVGATNRADRFLLSSAAFLPLVFHARSGV